MTERHETKSQKMGVGTNGWGAPYLISSLDAAGGDTPKALRDRGIYLENPYRFTYLMSIDRQISWKDPFAGGQVSQMSSNSFGHWPVFDAVATPQFADVVPKLLEAWRASSFDLGVTIGEGRESVELITERISDIIKSVRQLRKGNLGGALRTLAHVPKGGRRGAQSALTAGSIRNAWLELQYGWMPLIRDIYNAAEFVKLKPRIERVKARTTYRGSAKPYGSSIPQSRVQVFKNDRRLQLIVEVSHTPTMMERLGLTDPLSIAYDLTPLSFVADWFTPIGDYLKTLHAVNVMPVTQCIQTYSTKRDAICRVLSGDLYFGSPVIQGNASGRVEVTVDRTVHPSMPLAWAASLQTPREVSATYEPSLKRLADGAALASALLQGAFRR